MRSSLLRPMFPCGEFVCLSVRVRAQTAERIDVLFRVKTHGTLRNTVLEAVRGVSFRKMASRAGGLWNPRECEVHTSESSNSDAVGQCTLQQYLVA